MSIQDSIMSQYLAALEMLRQAIAKCPDALWADRAYKNPFWQVAYHTLHYTHLYLQPSREDFKPWAKHRGYAHDLNRRPSSAHTEPPVVEPYSREDVLAYLDVCRGQVEEQVPALDLDGPSGFHWLSFDKLELQFYNIRHLQQHTGELCERLGATGEIEVGWVATRPS